MTRSGASTNEGQKFDRRARWLRLASLIASAMWWVSLKSSSTRWLVLLNYQATAVVTPKLEPLASVSAGTLWMSLVCWLVWIAWSETLWRRDGTANKPPLGTWTWAVVYLTLASLPWWIQLVVHWNATAVVPADIGLWGPALWQPLWLAVFSGLAAERFVQALRRDPIHLPGSGVHLRSASRGEWVALVYAASVLCGIWWFWQSEQAFDRFMLGFNDGGHFAQRIANTAGGRGWLIESPVLPRFWDHFNPGLTLLAPLWMLWPKMSLFFLLQAVALTSSAPLIMALARLLGARAPAASIWALAWLCQPILGQMNLAYSYSWHPIVLSIPFLLATLCCVVRRQWWLAAAFAIVAGSFEEGVLVVMATSAATYALISWSNSASLRSGSRSGKSDVPGEASLGVVPSSHLLVVGDARASDSRLGSKGNAFLRPFRRRRAHPHTASLMRIAGGLSGWTWCGVAAAMTLVFILIFRYSGLAEFQTGRFVALGDGAGEILSSPIMRPKVFWTWLLRPRNAIFLAGLMIPCYIPALRRGWLLLLPALLPLMVLLVWDHLPAQSLAFHYPAILLPILWLSALSGATGPMRLRQAARARTIESELSRSEELPVVAEESIKLQRAQNAWELGWGALVTCVVASFAFGQLPWSASTVNDVDAFTYGAAPELRRDPGSRDHEFAHQQLRDIRDTSSRVLATGRLAMHLVGAPELETVGQFFERRSALAKLNPGVHPLHRYDILVLDRLEQFQQSPSQTSQLEIEALANGFRKRVERYELVVLERE